MEISSFNEIIINQKSLIICDIDETILYFEGIDKQWWVDTFNTFYKIHNDYDKADKLSLDKWISYIIDNNPYTTDEIGYNNMLKRVNDTNSRLLFLTARHEHLRDITLKHMLHLNIHNPILHFTNGNCKGQYILDNLINSSQNFEINSNNIIFIDDLLQNIANVSDKLAEHVTCYLFKLKQISDK